MPKIVDKDAKRLALIEAATEVFARDGYAATKMADVAKAASVGKGTVYEYFDSKPALFWAVCENLVHWPEDLAPFVDNPETGYRQLIDSLIESYEASISFYIILLDYWSAILRQNSEISAVISGRSGQLYDVPRAMIIDVVKAGQAKGVFAKAADPDVVAALTIAMIEGLRNQRQQDPAHMDFAACLRIMTDLLMTYLKTGTR